MICPWKRLLRRDETIRGTVNGAYPKTGDGKSEFGMGFRRGIIMAYLAFVVHFFEECTFGNFVHLGEGCFYMRGMIHMAWRAFFV